MHVVLQSVHVFTQACYRPRAEQHAHLWETGHRTWTLIALFAGSLRVVKGHMQDTVVCPNLQHFPCILKFLDSNLVPAERNCCWLSSIGAYLDL